MRIRLPIGHQ